MHKTDVMVEVRNNKCRCRHPFFIMFYFLCVPTDAFTCNSNIPWAIDDDLAYGFAAAHLSGQSEADWCCKCYQLTFTSDPVNGKKMIVQVTNTGGDLGVSLLRDQKENEIRICVTNSTSCRKIILIFKYLEEE